MRTASDIDRIRPEAQSIGQVAIGERPDNARPADAAGLPSGIRRCRRRCLIGWLRRCDPVESSAAYRRGMTSAAALPPAPRPRAGGDVDLAAVGALLADPGRCRILLALDDGRALPASRLATEAGVTAATASGHLGKLTSAGLLAVERHGRYRYYRLAGQAVAQLIETLGQLAPVVAIRSLRQDTSAAALRRARTCYDHLAGRLGTALMHSFLDARWLTGGNGHHDPDDVDPRAGYGSEYDYRLTETESSS